jgi:putative DNA primase/helicase
MTAAEIAKHLRKARKSGDGWLTCCVAHDDGNPSLSLTDAPGGRILVHCHAGCSQEAVVAALKDRGLWPEPEQQPRRIVKSYIYTDATGKPLYEVCRLEPKSFLQRYSDGRGGWIWRKHPRQVLYNLPDVLRNEIIFVVEGERDCETLGDYGFVATTPAGGAPAPWLPEFSEALRGREVVILPDNDTPGKAKAAIIADALIDVARRVCILDLDDTAADGRSIKDVTDWFEAGHSEVELIALVEANG